MMICKSARQIVLSLLVLFVISHPLTAEKIVFSANKMTGQAGNTNTKTSLSGNAYVKTANMEIQADELELSGDEYRYIKASGHIVGKNLEANMDFTCDSLEYDRTTKIAELKGNVKLTDLDNDVRAEAQIITYNQQQDIAILQIKIQLFQKDNVCSGAYAVYYKETQILELSGNAQVTQNEDTFRAQYITLNMKTQDITLDGNVKGKVTESSKKDESAEAEEGEPSDAENGEEDNSDNKNGEGNGN